MRGILTGIMAALLVSAAAATAGLASETSGIEDVLKTAKDLENLVRPGADSPVAKCKTAWDIAGKLAHKAQYKIDDRIALFDEIAEFEKVKPEVRKIVKSAIEKEYLVVGNSVTLGPDLKALVDQRRISPDDVRTVRGMITSTTEILLRLPQVDTLKGLLADGVLTSLGEDWKAAEESKNYDRMASVLENYKRQMDAVIKAFPDKPALKDVRAVLDEQEQEIQAGVEKAIADKTWPGHYKGFTGPGEADKLAASCMEYFRKSSDWGARKDNPEVPVAVVIRGNWISVRKNLIDETTQWGLPVTVAVKRDWGPHKGRDIAMIFEVVMLTANERGVAQAPPWSCIRVGNISKMRLSKVPPDKSAPSGSAAK